MEQDTRLTITEIAHQKLIDRLAHDPSPRITEEEREALVSRLAELRKAEEAIDKVRQPLTDAIREIEAVRQALLDRHQLEIVGNCEGCGKLLFSGELGHVCRDGPKLCEACAPSFVDAKQNLEGIDPNYWISPEERAEDIARAQAEIDAGRGDAKHVWPL